MTNREKFLKAQRQRERMKNKEENVGVNIAINILQVLPLYILSTEYGFGNRRLERFLTRLYELTDQVKNDRNILNKACDCLCEDYGIKISFCKDDNRAENIWAEEMPDGTFKYHRKKWYEKMKG